MARRLRLRLAALLPLVAVAPLAAGRLPVQRFDISRGLAGDKVWDLELDASGALWIATTTGVSRFDGVRFRSFDVRHGLPNSNIVRLVRLADGRLAAGTGAGVALLDPLRGVGERPWRTLPADADRQGGLLDGLAEDAAGTLWAAGQLGLFRAEGASGAERLVAQPLPEGERRVRLLAAAPDGALWALLDHGLRRRAADGSWSGPWALPDALEDTAGPTELWVESDGTLWIGSRRAVCALAPARAPSGPGGERVEATPRVDLAAAWAARSRGESFCVDVDGGLPPTRSRRVIKGVPDGRLLIVGSAGLVEVGPAAVALRLASVDVGGASLESALEGSDGALWIGTADRGVLHQLRSGVELVGGDDELPGTVSTLLVRGADVAVVVDQIEARRRLLRLDGDRFVDRTPTGAGAFEASWGWGEISTFGPAGAWWVGRSGGVVTFPARADGGFGEAVAPPPALARALAAEEPIRLHFTADGSLWIASHEPPALHRTDPASGRTVSFPEVEAFPSGPPTVIAEGADGAVWLGFYRGGLARRRDPERFEWLAGVAETVRGFVYGLTFDREDRLWVAAGGGLVLCATPGEDDPRCERFQPGSELDHLQIFEVAEDRSGRIVVGSARGLFLVDPTTRRADLLTTAEGLPINSATAVAPAADGGTWIASGRRLVHLSPPPPSRAPAPVRIVALEVAGRPYPVPLGGLARIPRLVLAPGERIVEIEVASVHLGSGPPPAYQWRVGSADWSPPSTDRRLRLAGLAAGHFVVEARAVSDAGVLGPALAGLELEVLPPLWLRPWFLAAAAALLAVLLALAYRLRVARLLELERVRTRIAADLHDDLGSALSRISILAEVARRQAPPGAESEGTLETIGASARDLAEMASDIVWAIDPQRDDLGSWAARLRRFGEDLFAPQGVRFEIVAPEGMRSVRLPAASRRDLYLLAKEALNNAAKYAAARRVEVRVQISGGRLELAIEDDGRGLDAGAERAAAARGGGRGLRSMRERALRLGGELEVGARADGAGTRIALAFDL